MLKICFWAVVLSENQKDLLRASDASSFGKFPILWDDWSHRETMYMYGLVSRRMQVVNQINKIAPEMIIKLDTMDSYCAPFTVAVLVPWTCSSLFAFRIPNDRKYSWFRAPRTIYNKRVVLLPPVMAVQIRNTKSSVFLQQTDVNTSIRLRSF